MAGQQDAFPRRRAAPTACAALGAIDKPAAHTGVVHASLRWVAPGAPTGEITVEWPEGVSNPIAAIRGTVAEAAVIARTAAP